MLEDFPSFIKEKLDRALEKLDRAAYNKTLSVNTFFTQQDHLIQHIIQVKVKNLCCDLINWNF